MGFQTDKRVLITGGAVSETSIKGFLRMILEYARLKGKIVTEAPKPSRQPERCLDTGHEEQEFGFKARTNLYEGVRGTIDWHREQRARGLL
jgi:nucleoside-diphosphate-sugar epimerase